MGLRDTVFETERLFIRPIQPADYEPLHAIYRDGETMRFVPSRPHTSVEETGAELERQRSRSGAHLWTVCDKASRESIGVVQFLGETRVPGMGFMLHRAFWGKGLAEEACRPALAYGFEELRYDRIELWIDERNTRSISLARRLGFEVKGRIPQKYTHRADYHFLLVYGLESPAAAPSTRFFRTEPVLPVCDIPASVEYYKNVLGFHVDFVYGDPPNHAGVSRGEWSGSVVVIQLSKLDCDRGPLPSGHLQVFVDASIDALWHQYRSRDVEIVATPDDKPWGLREFAIRDINGHVLVFASFL